MKTCIVTMFFNLAKSPDATSATRPLEFYLQHGAPTLRLPYEMVIFCDEETKPLIEFLRGDRPTTYIVKSIFDYDHVKQWLPSVKAGRLDRPRANPRITPSYFAVTTFKPMALYLAKQHVAADTYMWLDFGASHIARGFPSAVQKIVDNPRPKIAACYIHYRPKSELYPMTKYLATEGPCGMAATAFTVEASYVERFFFSMMAVCYEQVALGVAHNEEQAMIYVYDRNPEWFSLYFGDYQSTLTNYHYVKEDTAIVESCFIQKVKREGNIDLLNAISTYGKEDIDNAVAWHPNSKAANLIRDAFDHFVLLGDRFHPGWGSYMIDGERYRYHLATLKKQEALVRVGEVSSHVLEIGVYLGHSLLLLLLSNPTLRITCIDNDSTFSPKAVKYLNSQFGNRITFHLGNAADILPTLPPMTYDCVHIDADHYDEAVRQQFALSKPLATPGAFFVFDDYDAVHTVIDDLLATHVLDEIERPGCLWTNIVTQLRQ
jgi:hypothetical protein